VRILFDQGTPAPLRQLLVGHAVSTAYELGWSTLKNGELLAAAEAQGFELFLTTDTNLKYQQNLTGRRIGIVILGTTSWPRIKAAAETVVEAVGRAQPGVYLEVAVP
jgi:hypothetical protein